jgi:hypothetical protein
VPIQVVRETHDTPTNVQERLTRAGGLNRFGEPNYRAVWGWNRLTPIGGKWEDNGNVEIRMEPKYPQVNRWHIEKWVPAETYGPPELWELTTKEEGIPALGPYPSRGEYEHCFTLEGPRGEFIQLTPTVAEYIARAIERSRGTKPKKSTLYNREARKDEEYVNWAMDSMDDNPTWSYTPHAYIPASIKEKIA